MTIVVANTVRRYTPANNKAGVCVIVPVPTRVQLARPESHSPKPAEIAILSPTHRLCRQPLAFPQTRKTPLVGVTHSPRRGGPLPLVRPPSASCREVVVGLRVGLVVAIGADDDGDACSAFSDGAGYPLAPLHDFVSTWMISAQAKFNRVVRRVRNATARHGPRHMMVAGDERGERKNCVNLNPVGSTRIPVRFLDRGGNDVEIAGPHGSPEMPGALKRGGDMDGCHSLFGVVFSPL